MKRYSMPILLVATLVVAAFPMVGAAQSTDVLFQEAQRLERVQGDYQGAIGIYQQIVGGASTERTLVARALVQMGKAYESLGRTEAFSVYERVVRDFADVDEQVSEARSRMRGLAVKEPVSGGTRLVKLEPALSTHGSWGGSFTPDGRYFVNTASGGVRIGYQEVGKSGVTYITPPQPDSPWSTPQDPAFSPDGRFIAYDWIDANSGYESSLRVFDIANGTTRVVLTGPYGEFYVSVLEWSSDGSSILVALAEAESRRVALIDAESGESLRSVAVDRGFGDSCLLEDRYVLFKQSSLMGSDVRIVDLESGQTDDILPGVATRSLLGCSNLKQVALIRTDVYGEDQVWMYGIKAGKPAGEPVHVPGIEPEVVRVSINNAGDFLYFRDNSEVKTKLYPYSAQDGVITGRGESLPKAQVTWPGPGWTRTGDRLAYRVGWTEMWVRERDGTSRVVQLARWTNRYKWSADGTKFIAASVGDGTGAVTYRLDAETGAVVDSTSDFFGTPGIAGDAFLGVGRKDSATVCVYEVASGSTSPHEFICYPEQGSDPVSGDVYLSPDNRKLIVAPREGPFTLVDLETRTARPLADDPSHTQFSKRTGLSWLPDASGVVGRQGGSLVRLPLSGGPSIPELVQFSKVNAIGWVLPHPSGDQIVINSTYKSPDDDDDAPKDLHVIAGAVDRLGKRN